MRINELISSFEIYTTNEEKAMLEQLSSLTPLATFSEHEKVVIERLIKKSLVIRVGSENPKVIANEF